MRKNRSAVIALLAFSPFLLSSAPAEGREVQAEHLLRVTESLNSPLRIAIDDRNAVYVTDAIGDRIWRYDSEGAFSGELSSGFAPLAIAVTRRRSLCVGDRRTGRLVLMGPGGEILNEMGDLGLPSSAAVDDEDRLYVVDSRQKQVRVFDANGNDMAAFGEEILGFPTGIAFDRKNQRILVAEHGGMVLPNSSGSGGMLSFGGAGPGARIQVFDLQGNRLTSFGAYGYQEGQFTRIQGLAVDKRGRIYVADPFQGAVTVLDEDGAYLRRIGQFGSGPGDLRAPMDVAVDSRDRLWVASMNNGSLEVYDVSSQLPIPLPEDFDGNGLVDFDDFFLFADAFGGTDPAFDLNGDGGVGFDDFFLFADGFSGASRTKLIALAREYIGLPVSNSLGQNYPNPFNPGTWIPFVLAEEGWASIDIYNSLGERIRSFDLNQLQNGRLLNQSRALYWDGADGRGRSAGSGVYFYELRSRSFVAVRRMLLLK